MLDVAARAIDQMIRDVRDLTAERNHWALDTRAQPQGRARPPRRTHHQRELAPMTDPAERSATATSGCAWTTR